MASIGRNEPCPCGSGKKFKKCCMNKPNGLGTTRTKNWSKEDVSKFSTEEILTKLKSFGVEVDETSFLKAIENNHSAYGISQEWFKEYGLNIKGFDESFPWFAAWELWERLAPGDYKSNEQLDVMMQEGYALLDQDKSEEACMLWLEVWRLLKLHFTNQMTSVEEIEKIFIEAQGIFNWCQDLDNALEQAAVENIAFYKKRIDYCQDFIDTLPETDQGILKNMKRSVAESFFGLGQIAEGEAAFESIIKAYPNWEWGYIGWADMYSVFRINEKVPADYDKAERLYKMALNIPGSEKEMIEERLEEIREKRTL